MRRNGGQLLVECLTALGAKKAFGVPGESYLAVLDALYDTRGQFDYVLCRNEGGAGFMAAAYGKLTGDPGICLVPRGPGATNASIGVHTAMQDSAPMILLVGQVGTDMKGREAFQEVDYKAVFGTLAKWAVEIDQVERIPEIISRAWLTAISGRPGPVVIDVPKDVQNWTGPYRGAGELPIPGYRQRIRALETAALSERRCEEFYALLAQAERPLIYAGGGVVSSDAAPVMREFADRYGIPVVTTLMGLGAYDTTQPKSLHMLGMHGTAYANYAVDDCDFLITLGARFDDRVAGVPDRFAPNAKHIAHFDIDASEIGKVKPVHWHHVGRLLPALQALLEFGCAQQVQTDFSDWQAHVAGLKTTYAMNYDRDSTQIQPYAVLEAINRLTGGDAVIATGVGQHQMWAAQYFDFREPRLWLTSGSMGTMGFGLPAAIGAQFAQPNKLVIDIDGDASIRMNLGELETVTTYDLPVKIVVLNNFGDGMVKQWQKLFFKGRFAFSDKSLHKKDFVKAAEADGFPWARRLDAVEDIDAVVKSFVEFDGPAFLEVIIDPEAGVYPMVGPGMSYSEMITGDHIPSRHAPTEQADQSEMF